MKPLQNNFTTPEQSKRLLELGMPKSSADCYYLCYSDGTVINRTEPDIIPFEGFHKMWQNNLPCWSVGRLIEISELCYTSLSEHDYFIRQKDCNIDFLIKMFELGADRMDFSKLED